MQIKRTLLLAIVLLSSIYLVNVSAYGQARRRADVSSTPMRAEMPTQKRRVILDLVEQEPIGADFIQADATSITVELSGSRRVFKMDEVVSIIFSPDEAKRRLSQTVSSQNAALASETLRMLRRINSALDVGVSYIQYRQLLVEVKGQVDEALASIPAGELRNEIILAMEAYADAAQAWSERIGSKSDSINSILPPFDKLLAKYRVQDARVSSLGVINTTLKKLLNTIWQAARTNINRASSLLNQ
jgi:hypothetical protein